MAERFRIAATGLSFHVRLTPKGGRDAVEGWDAASNGLEHLKCRVRAVPEDGKANTALIALLADRLSLSKSAIEIVSGATSRLKRVVITGDAVALAARLETLT